MSDKTELWCIIEGDDTPPFSVTISTRKSIDKLKKAIKKVRSNHLQRMDAPILSLWKPKVVIPVKPSDTLAERVLDLGPLSLYAEKLDPADLVANVFPNQNSTFTQLCIIMQPPAQIDDDQRPAKRIRYSDISDEGNMAPQAGHDTFFHTPSKPLAEVKNSIHEILERYRRTMNTLVKEAGRKPLIPLWTPNTESGNTADMAFRNHAEKLGIPSVNGMPCLLLHELGSETTDTRQKQAQNIADIFSPDSHTVLINTSGSGKTRLGLHGLCQNWGFYGVAHAPSDGIGSGDFDQLMSSLDYSLDYSRANQIRNVREAARHMRQKVQRRVWQFLLARFLLLNLLLEEASNCGGLRPSDHRRLWVLLQARPTDLLSEDAFKVLSKALNISSLDDLETQIREQFSKLEKILEHRPIYCFLDEIQSTTSERMGECWSHDMEKERPLLRPVWQAVTQILGSKMRVILSGTAINEASLLDVLDPFTFKILPYSIKKDIGVFDDPEVQREYIKHYLPDGQPESASRQEFFRRAWGWCRGRYRSTATLIAFVLAFGPYSPHKTLNKFVELSTNFRPTDGEKWCADEPDINFNNKKEVDRLKSSATRDLHGYGFTRGFVGYGSHGCGCGS